MAQPTNNTGSPLPVYMRLASCDGKVVEQLLKDVCFEPLGMTERDKQPHCRCGLITLKFIRNNPYPALMRFGSSIDDVPHLWGTERDDGDEILFTAVHVAVKELIPAAKKKIRDKSELLNAVYTPLQDLGKFQFSYFDSERSTQVYTLPVPGVNQAKPTPCIMVTNAMMHTTICWKRVKVGNYQTLAIAHLDVENYRYKTFQTYVRNFARLQVPDANGQMQLMDVDGCWGPEDYFGLVGNQFTGYRQRSRAGASCVVVGVWNSSTDSWELYVQKRSKLGDLVADVPVGERARKLV